MASPASSSSAAGARRLRWAAALGVERPCRGSGVRCALVLGRACTCTPRQGTPPAAAAPLAAASRRARSRLPRTLGLVPRPTALRAVPGASASELQGAGGRSVAWQGGLIMACGGMQTPYSLAVPAFGIVDGCFLPNLNHGR